MISKAAKEDFTFSAAILAVAQRRLLQHFWQTFKIIFTNFYFEVLFENHILSKSFLNKDYHYYYYCYYYYYLLLLLLLLLLLEHCTRHNVRKVPSVGNRASIVIELNRTQSNLINGLSLIEFDYRTNKTQSNRHRTRSSGS